MALTFNTSPYYDDFNESKQFYRVLFRPGRAVQGRELNQLQTTLQNQITRFGQGVFKEGSIVVPGQSQVDIFYKFVKLESIFNSVVTDDVINDLVGVEITGQTTGVRALVVNASRAVGEDPPTIYVKYLDSGTNNTTGAFAGGEVLSNEDGTISVQVTTAAATGSSLAFSVQPGIIFIKGVFAYFEAQTLIVSKYNNVPTKSVGFKITESYVTSDDDGSLLDPAVGTYNYFAPGADRYKIALDLEARDLIPTGNEDPDYVELCRIENGVILQQKINPEYVLLNDTLARRTYDESGNYVVRPYGLEVINHLRTSNASIRDGLYSASEGGNSSLYVNVIKPGKAYVLGYELENIKTQFVPSSKARDFVAVNNGTIDTTVGNYVLITGVYSIPDLSVLCTVNFYNTYTASAGSPAGTLTGTGRARALEYYSGSGASTVYKLYLFDVEMIPGYTFEDDVKQIYFDNIGYQDFTANIFPTFVNLTGTVATSNGSNVITGSGSRFESELSENNYISVNGNIIQISNVVSDYTAYATTNIVGTLSGITASRHDANIALTDKSAYIFELPYNTIKTVDTTGSETTYYARRIYDRTLSSGNTTINAGTDEVFVPYSADNYIAINKTTGAIMSLTGNVALSGSPTGKTITFTLGSSFGTNDIRFITTLAKSNTAADKKTKTLTSSFSDYISNTTATATVLSLGRPDVYKISNVMMSSNAFGTAFSISNSSNIMSRYTFDNGQRKTHYDLATLTLKPGQPKPTGPIRIYFDYFTHSAGDYFSVESYTDIDYESIPAFQDGTKTYQLRDCIDFRPVIDTSGNIFTSPPEFLDQDVYFTTDYEYYLPRTDKLVIDSTGEIKVVKGVSSLDPVEPLTPQNSMALFVLKQKPYVFDPKKDIDITVIDNRRYTMRDIGRIENRVKTLEYYTTLSLLEKDTALYQVKDELGFDRFKNGFVVDNFLGHQVGDEKNPDYGISMDLDKGELRPLFETKNLRLVELASTNNSRLGNNYIRTGNIASLPYSRALFVESNAASRVENINPFSVLQYTGTVELDPPSDVWFDTTKLPDVYIDQEGNYNTLVEEAKAKGTYGTVWNNWATFWNGSTRVEERTGITYTINERIDTTTNNDVIVSKSVIPKMRSVNIKFTGRGLKPNTKLQVFFDDFRVTEFCTGSYNQANTSITANAFLTGYVINKSNVVTDINGTVEGTFSYDADFFNLPTGVKIFRLTDSPTNNADSETQAEAYFAATGELRSIRNEIISTRNGYITTEAVFDRREIAEPPYIPPEPIEETIYVPEQVSDPESPDPSPGQLRSTDITISGDQYFFISRTGIETSTGTVNVTVPVAGTVTAQFIRQPTGSAVSISPSSLSLPAGGTGSFTYSVTTSDSTSARYGYDIAFLAAGDPGTYDTLAVIQQRDNSSGHVEPTEPDLTYSDLLYGYALGTAAPVTLTKTIADTGAFATINDAVNTMTAADKTYLASFVASDGRIDPAAIFNAVESGAMNSNLSSNDVKDAVQQAFDAAKFVINVQTDEQIDYLPRKSAIREMRDVYDINDVNTAVNYAAAQMVVALLADDALPDGAVYKNDIIAANNNPDSITGTLRPNAAAGEIAARNCWGNDPLAQTFIVVGNPVTLIGADIYFYAKDEVIPVTVEIRKVVNGIPTQTIIPFSRKIVSSGEINTSLDASIPTYVAFDGLVYLEPGEYAIVLIANSVNYRVWVSQVGETDVLSEKIISEQPFIGSLLKSQNASTWTPEQSQDLKFRLYRANFNTSVTGVIDFGVNLDEFQYKALGAEPLEAYPNSNQLRVYHPENGFTNGSMVKLTGLPTSNISLTSQGNIFGVNTALIDNVEFAVSNVKQNSYTITLPYASNVTTVTRGGGNGIVVRQDLKFDALYPAISYLEFAGTTVSQRAKLTNLGYSLSSTFTDVKKDSTTELTTSAVIPSFINITNNLGGNRPFTMRLALNTDNPYISPLVDMQQNSVVLIKNLINNPSYTSENTSQDIMTVAHSSSIYFTSLSDTTGLISIPSISDQANVTSIVKGTTITVSNSSVNSSSFRVLDIMDSGANIKVFGDITTASASNVITITNGKEFIAEEASLNGSAISKYITKEVDFLTPSTSFNLRLDISQPTNTEVKIYYKAKNIGETTPISDKEYIEIGGITVPESLSGEFFEVEKQLDGLTQFNGIVLKIVLLSSNTAVVPKCKNLRLISLA